MKYYSIQWNAAIAGIPCFLAYTGYTGEEGAEIYAPAEAAETLWDALLEAGKDEGILPCGLGARDTLRLEAGMPLYGHELGEDISPLEAGLSRFVCLDKEDFVGRQALLAGNPPARKRIGLIAIDRGILREHMDVYIGNELVGQTTSGTKCPYINQAAAQALLRSDVCEPGREVEVDVRGKRVKAKMVRPVFYRREKR